MPFESVRKIMQVGGSKTVALPPSWLRALGLGLGDDLLVLSGRSPFDCASRSASTSQAAAGLGRYREQENRKMNELVTTILDELKRRGYKITPPKRREAQLMTAALEKEPIVAKGEIIESPLVSPADPKHVLEAMRRFEEFKTKALKPSDYVILDIGKEKRGYIKKSGWMKYALACQLSLEKRDERVEDLTGGERLQALGELVEVSGVTLVTFSHRFRCARQHQNDLLDIRRPLL